MEIRQKFDPNLMLYLDGEGRILDKSKLYLFINRKKEVSVVKAIRPADSKRNAVIAEFQFYLVDGEVTRSWRRGHLFAVRPDILFEYTEDKFE